MEGNGDNRCDGWVAGDGAGGKKTVQAGRPGVRRGGVIGDGRRCERREGDQPD